METLQAWPPKAMGAGRQLMMPQGQFSEIHVTQGSPPISLAPHERPYHPGDRGGPAAAARRARGHCVRGTRGPRGRDLARRRPHLCTAAQIPLCRHDKELRARGKHADWRKGWDSNPRWTCAHASFQDWCLKPLGHPSKPVVLGIRLLPDLRPDGLTQSRSRRFLWFGPACGQCGLESKPGMDWLAFG